MGVISSRLCPLVSKKYSPRPPKRWMICILSVSKGPLPYAMPWALIRPIIELFVTYVEGVAVAIKRVSVAEI